MYVTLKVDSTSVLMWTRDTLPQEYKCYKQWLNLFMATRYYLLIPVGKLDVIILLDYMN